ncbi:MAG: Uma2 family endonuclease [Thermomicrobiales bacterium]
MAQLATTTNRTGERRLRMTYEEFLASEVSESHAEWVDGEVTVFMPQNLEHHDIVNFLYEILSLLLRRTGAGKVLNAPFEMRLSSRSSREPDLLVVKREHINRLDGQRLNGPADLAIEVISPESVTRDRSEKLAEYEAAGVREYFLVDPRRRARNSILYRLNDDGRYEIVPPDADGRYRFRVLPGFWLDESWLWQDPLPDPLDVLADIAPEHFGGYKRASGQPHR